MLGLGMNLWDILSFEDRGLLYESSDLSFEECFSSDEIEEFVKAEEEASYGFC